MPRFLQHDDSIRFNPVILVIRFWCLIPSSLQVQCLVRDTTTRGILVKGVDRRTENRGGRVLFSSAFGCNDIWSRKWGRLNFGVLWCKHHLKFHKDHSRGFLGGAADFCICSYEVVLYLQPDVKPDSWTTIDVSHTRFVAANHEHINLTGSLGFWIRDDFPTKTPARFFTGFLEGNIHRNSGGHRWFRGPPARFERHFLKLKIEVARWVFQLPLADDENDVHEIYKIFSLTYI